MCSSVNVLMIHILRFKYSRFIIIGILLIVCKRFELSVKNNYIY